MLTFFDDAALSVVSFAARFVQTPTGSLAAQDRVVYLGSTADGYKYQAASNPGVDPILVTVTDADTGSAPAAGTIKLATSQAGLATATGGASLAVGTEIVAGPGNAVAVWIRGTFPAGMSLGMTLDLALETSSEVEVLV